MATRLGKVVSKYLSDVAFVHFFVLSYPAEY